MHLIKADHYRAVALVGVPGLVPRPVDIDQTSTNFKALRTLRIYRFAPPAVIDGHAEEDEVYIVVLTGSVDLVMRSENWPDSGASFRLTAPNDREAVACAAYLPRQAEYQLTPIGSAEVAYARAKPAGNRAPRILTSAPRVENSGACVLLEESTHAERLRFRLIQIDAGFQSVAVNPIRHYEEQIETLIHVRTRPVHIAATLETKGSPSTSLESWDTIALAPGSNPTLRISAGSSAVGFIVMAS